MGGGDALASRLSLLSVNKEACMPLAASLLTDNMLHSGSSWPWYQLGHIRVTAWLRSLHTKLLALAQNHLVGYLYATIKLTAAPFLSYLMQTQVL